MNELCFKKIVMVSEDEHLIEKNIIFHFHSYPHTHKNHFRLESFCV